jgi:hypothetical protein
LELWLQNTQLIVGAKVAKNVVHPQAALFTQSASCRACGRFIQLSFCSIFTSFAFFLLQCFSYMRSGVGDLSSDTPPHPTVRDVFTSHFFLRSLVACSSSDGAIWSNGTASRT